MRAEYGSCEIDAWVVIKPDDIIRIACLDMGQGTLTGAPTWSPRNSTPSGRRARPNSRCRAKTSVYRSPLAWGLTEVLPYRAKVVAKRQ